MVVGGAAPDIDEITEEVELGETLKSQCPLRPDSAYSTKSQPIHEGGDDGMMEMVEDGTNMAAGMAGKVKPVGHGEEDPVTAFLT